MLGTRLPCVCAIVVDELYTCSVVPERSGSVCLVLAIPERLNYPSEAFRLLDLYHHHPTTIPRRVSLGLTQPRPSQHNFVLKFIITKLPVVSGASKNSETGTCRVEARFVCTRQLHSTQDHHHSSSQPKSPFPPYPSHPSPRLIYASY